ncbi:MAG: hypothetical protein ACREPB_12845 [Arenimonas sp.]
MNGALAWRTTRACLIGNVGSLMLVIYLVAISVALIIFASSKASEYDTALLLMFSFPAYFWWAFVGSRLLKIIRDTDKWLTPAPIKGTVSSVVLQAAITIIIPATLLAFTGQGFLYGLVCLTAISACGLLFMLLPRALGISMSLLPTLFTKLVEYEILPANNTNDFIAVMAVLSLAMIGLVIWRFQRLRNFEGDISAWNTPMALMPDAANGWGMKSGSDSNSIRFEPAIQTIAPLNSPKLAMRTFLGAPFMPLTARSQIKQWLLFCGAYLVLPLYLVFSMTASSGKNDSVTAAMMAFWISLGGLGISISALLMRLNTLYAKDNAELAELALLPGWHNGRSAKQVLAQVLSMHVARSLLIPMTFSLLALTFIKTENHDGFLIILSLFTSGVLIAAGYGMNIISGKKPHAFLLVLVFIAMFLISMVQLIFSVNSREFDNVWLTVPAWIVFPTVAIVYCLSSWRPFQKRMHPFLRN